MGNETMIFPHNAVIDLSAREDHCCICGNLVIGGDKGIPCHEDIPVPHDWGAIGSDFVRVKNASHFMRQERW